MELDLVQIQSYPLGSSGWDAYIGIYGAMYSLSKNISTMFCIQTTANE